MKTQKMMAMMLALFVCVVQFAVAETENTPPAIQEDQHGEMPAMPDGQGAPDGMPDGQGGPGSMPGMPGGQSSKPESYGAVNTYSEDTEIVGETITSTGTDENAVLVTGGTTALDGVTIERTSDDSIGGDASSFYGVGAAVLVTEGTVNVTNSTITSDASGGAGVFAYGDGVAIVEDTTITTTQNTSGGIHVAGGGTLYAKNLTVSTEGESAAAIRSDRGSGTMVVDGGTYISSGVGSPAVYVTADIAIRAATLCATGSEALCLEGLNSVRLYDCDLMGSMDDLSQNDNTWTVILYQSMSGDSEIGEGRFEMNGGTLSSNNGGLFYTTNTESEFVLSNVNITAAEDSEFFLRCTGNSNQRGWGMSGQNGADCKFTAIAQQMDGDVIWDSISTLQMYVLQGSTLTGAVIDDETCAGEGGNGTSALIVDADSTWVVTGDSTLTTLSCAGNVVDAAGNAVRIVGTDGTVFVEGSSEYTVTVQEYTADCNASGAGTLSDWSNESI